ncbi:FHA domain-containing protein [Lentzea sp. NPDC054927]
MEPFSILAAIASAASASASVFREIREWRSGRRDKLELSADRSGYLHPLYHHGAALMAPDVMIPAYSTCATVIGQFFPADDVAARRLTTGDSALVLLWPSGGDPAFESLLFTCTLEEIFIVEVPGGRYDLVAYVLDRRRDEVLGTAWIESLWLPWSSETELMVDVIASEALYMSDVLSGQIGDTAGELVLPSGIRYPLGTVTTIGRSPKADLKLQDHEVSSHHAYIEFRDGSYHIQDLGSTNGTLVNGQFVGLRSLQNGDEITIAGWSIEFRLR